MEGGEVCRKDIGMHMCIGYWRSRNKGRRTVCTFVMCEGNIVGIAGERRKQVGNGALTRSAQTSKEILEKGIQTASLVVVQRERHSFQIPIHTHIQHMYTTFKRRTLIANKEGFFVCSSLVVLPGHHRRRFP